MVAYVREEKVARGVRRQRRTLSGTPGNAPDAPIRVRCPDCGHLGNATLPPGALLVVWDTPGRWADTVRHTYNQDLLL